jgi:hypothetical protein
MCHNSGAGKTVDLTRNATLRYVYDSVSVHNSMQMGGRPHWMISKPHYMYADLRWIVKFPIACSAHGIPTYMKRMVAHLEPLVDGSTPIISTSQRST